MADTKVRGEVASVKHVATSRSGNPTYRVTLADGRSWLTETDGAVGYGARNVAPSHGEHHTVTLTIRRGRIIYMTEA